MLEKAQKSSIMAMFKNAPIFLVDDFNSTSISDKSLQTLWGFEFGDVKRGGLQAGVVSRQGVWNMMQKGKQLIVHIRADQHLDEFDFQASDQVFHHSWNGSFVFA